MTAALVSTALLVLVVLLVSIRRLRWAPIDRRRLFRVPIVFVGVGAVTFATSGLHHVALDSVLVLAVEVTVSAGVGAALGLLSQLRQSTSLGQSLVECRTPWFGLILWIVVILLRFAIVQLVAGPSSTGLATAASLLVFGANRLMFAVTLDVRMRQFPASQHPGVAQNR